MPKNTFAGILIGLAIGGMCGYLFAQIDLHEQTHVTPSTQNTTSDTPSVAEVKANHQMHNVNYDDTGFTPATLTVKAGDMVTWMNNSTGELMTAFGEHGDHDEYPDGKAHPTIEKGTTETITFPDTGTFTYHNHHNDELSGTIIVN